MDPANRSTTSPPFRLLDLPLELQRIIFGYALFTKTTLRTPTEAKRYGDVVIFSGTNILRVSSQIKEETLPIFYQVNHFHYEQLVEGDQQGHFVVVQNLPLVFHRSLHMMRHISIDPVQCQPCGRNCLRSDIAPRQDSILADILIQIGRIAPNLRTLAIHFAPFTNRYSNSRFLHEYYNVLPPICSIDNAVISILCQLHARLSRLSLVYFGKFTALEEIRSNIAPLGDWTARTLESWPVTVIPSLSEYINRWQEPDPNLRTRVWDICRHPGLHAGDQEF